MILKKINPEDFDILIDKINAENFFYKEKNAILAELEQHTKPILLNGQSIELYIDDKKYLDAIYNSSSKGEASIKIAQYLHEDFRIDGKPIPADIMFEKELWAYLNLTIFFDVNRLKFIDEDAEDDKLKNKIIRVYFNSGNVPITRSGLRYLWILADSLCTNKGYDLVRIAQQFIDPVKAIHECVLGRNPIVLKGFVMAIKQLGCDSRIKNKYFRTIIPKHIRNHACSNYYDGYTDPNQLANIIAQQIQLIFANYEVFTYLD